MLPSILQVLNTSPISTVVITTFFIKEVQKSVQKITSGKEKIRCKNNRKQWHAIFRVGHKVHYCWTQKISWDLPKTEGGEVGKYSRLEAKSPHFYPFLCLCPSLCGFRVPPIKSLFPSPLYLGNFMTYFGQWNPMQGARTNLGLKRPVNFHSLSRNWAQEPENKL